MKNVLRFGLIVSIIILALIPSVILADTGKIAGSVVDESKDPVIGASVQIVGTTMGAPVKVDGTYVILAVPPGTYSIRISCQGYGTQTFNGVEVTGGNTATLNVTMKEQALQMGDVNIEYTPPPVKIDVSGKDVVISAKELGRRAAQDLNGILVKQPGFKVDPEGGIHVRGGRDHEALVKVDGQDYRDPLVNSSKRLVNLSALNVQEIEILTGGDARYGQFQSALINVTTPEGSSKNYSGVAGWHTDRAFSQYSFHTDMYEYSLSGPVPLVDKWIGKEKLSFFTSGSSRLTNTYTPYDINRPNADYLNIGVKLPERQSNDYTTFWKLTYRIDPTKKLNLTYSKDFSQFDIYPDGEAAVDGNYGWQYKYDVANRPWARSSQQAISLAFQHNVSKNTFYEFTLSNFNTTTKIQPRGKTPGDFTLEKDAEDQNRNVFGSVDSDKDGFVDGYVDANRNGQYDGAGEGYDDLNKNGKWDRGEDWVDLNGNGLYDGAEPWVDRANPQGINNIGVFDPWDPYVDLNHNGRWDPAEPQLPEQDWNHNGTWDGERFIDANTNGRYDGSGEGYDDRNRNGKIDSKNLFTDAQDTGEPFVDGDYWYDTGEPFQDLPDTNGFYNGTWDTGETWYDLPSSTTGPFTRSPVPTLNGVYDGPNGAFDEYEMFTMPASLQYGMDPQYPVLYTWEDVRLGIRHGGQEWLTEAPMQVTLPTGETRLIPGYLKFDSRPSPWNSSMQISTWTNATMNDQASPYFNIPNFSWDQGQEKFADYNANGVEDPVADAFLNPGQWDATSLYMQREAKEWNSKLDLTSQVNKYHELKAGFEIKERDLNMTSIQQPDQPYENVDVPLPLGSPWPDRGYVRDFYDYKPWEGAIYFQDKMEFEGMIVRAGVRSDFVIQPNSLLDAAAKAVGSNQPGALLAKRGRYVIAPRLGISHPISDKAKLYFNYGHFYQTPSFSYFYTSATANINPNTQIGNPNLEYEKTVSYELGVNTEFYEDWVIDVAGYYRDVFNQIGTVEQKIPPITLNRYFNLGYARARGFELSLKKNFSNLWALTFNYDFAYAYGKESATAEGLLQRVNNLPENRDEHPLNWDQTHSISAYLTFSMGEKDKKELFGVRVPADWLSTVEFTYGSGYPYTPSTYTTGTPASLILANSARMPWTMNVDMKVDKFWTLVKGLRLTTGIEVYNLFDRHNVRSIYAETGSPYVSTDPANPGQTAAQRLAGSAGTDFDHNPRNFSAPRQIMLHFQIGF